MVPVSSAWPSLHYQLVAWSECRRLRQHFVNGRHFRAARAIGPASARLVATFFAPRLTRCAASSACGPSTASRLTTSVRQHFQDVFVRDVHVDHPPKLSANDVQHRIVVEQQSRNEESAGRVLPVAQGSRRTLQRPSLVSGYSASSWSSFRGSTAVRSTSYQPFVDRFGEDDVIQLPRHRIREQHPFDSLICRVVDRLPQVPLGQGQADGLLPR